MQIKSIGIDPGKTTFHLAALGTRCQLEVRKKFSRQPLLLYPANPPSSLMGDGSPCAVKFSGPGGQGRTKTQANGVPENLR
jgi:transposase